MMMIVREDEYQEDEERNLIPVYQESASLHDAYIFEQSSPARPRRAAS
jgi:hypothetical protein